MTAGLLQVPCMSNKVHIMGKDLAILQKPDCRDVELEGCRTGVGGTAGLVEDTLHPRELEGSNEGHGCCNCAALICVDIPGDWSGQITWPPGTCLLLALSP